MLYQLHEFQRSMLHPLTAWAQATAKTFTNPLSPMSLVPGATRLAAGLRTALPARQGIREAGLRYQVGTLQRQGHPFSIVEQTIIEKPFCKLVRFKRYADRPRDHQAAQG
ncbi:hypothetical protein ACU4GD_12735 [Cupriavidus basilensis]